MPEVTTRWNICMDRDTAEQWLAAKGWSAYPHPMGYSYLWLSENVQSWFDKTTEDAVLLQMRSELNAKA